MRSKFYLFCASAVAISLAPSVSAQSEKGRPSMPTSHPGEWVSLKDFPDKLLNTVPGTTIDFQLRVGKNGRVTECTVTKSNAITHVM